MTAKIGVAIALALAAVAAAAQQISADEMIQLEKLRAELISKGVTVTPEMEIRMLQRLRAASSMTVPNAPQAVAAPTGSSPVPSAVAPIQPVNGGGPAPTNLPQAAGPLTTPNSEEDFKAKLANLGAPLALNDVKMLRDGLMVDGSRFADSEGRATRFAVDTATGRVGYVVSVGASDNWTVKIARADKPDQAITIGQAKRLGNEFQFSATTGKTLSGEMFFALTDGVLLLRDSVGFRYIVGEGVRQINVPTGWSPTAVQRGNVSTTGWLLLEKDAPENKDSPFGALSRLGRMVSGGPANEYALLEMATGRMVEIDVSSDGKSVTSFSQCRRKNVVVNVCDRMTSYESAFRPDGSPNPTHYVWKIDWQRAADGPILVAEEGLLGAKLTAVDLKSGKKALLYERTLGVTLAGMRVTSEGKLSLNAKLGLASESMEDVAAEILARPNISQSGR